MVRSLLILFLLLTSGVSHASASRVLDFKFFDANGNEYSSVALKEGLRKFHHINSKASILLIYSPTLEGASLQKQLSLLGQHGAAEEMQMLYVVACPTAENRHGYYVASAQAQAVTANPSQFSVMVVGEGGRISKTWERVVTMNEIKVALSVTSNPALKRAP
jgi:hypothetical protein